MYTVNLNVKLKNIDGTESKEAPTLATTLVEVIGVELSDPDGRYQEWFLELLATKTITINDGLIDELKQYVKSSPRLYVFAKVQLVQAIEDAKK